MIGRPSRARSASADYWPGFVDALATLLLVITFLLAVFVLAQFFLNEALSGRDEALANLRSEVSELSTALNLAREEGDILTRELASLRATLADERARADRAEGQAAEFQSQLSAAEQRLLGLQTDLEDERAISADARDELAVLNAQMAELRAQLASLREALDAAEAKDAESQAVIADLGKRLNTALASAVNQLAQYRSEFFGRLRQILGDRTDVRIVGDRFVFQSEVLFPSGSDRLNPDGRQQLVELANAIKEIDAAIPEDLAWVLRVDGHSDARPIATPQFPTNWHLSAARAIAVVRFLVDQGVPPEHLVAAGFGAEQPLDAAETEDAYRRNRRIELKLTQR